MSSDTPTKFEKGKANKLPLAEFRATKEVSKWPEESKTKGPNGPTPLLFPDTGTSF